MNFLVQAWRKPTELLGLVFRPTPRTPEQTWQLYGPLFRAHATPATPPELLAALVQAESAGDPLARTYWRLRWSADPFGIYGPASSAVGLLQLTDGTFEEARRFCVHDNAPAQGEACWFNALYLRTVPGHAIEMTSGRLGHLAAELGAPRGASLAERQRLAVVIHLCGRGRGELFAARGFRPRPGEACGDHDLAAYLARVEALRARFERLAANGGGWL